MFNTTNYSGLPANRNIIFLTAIIFIFFTTQYSYALNFLDEESALTKEQVIEIVTEYLREDKGMQTESIMLGDFKYTPLKLNSKNYSVTVSERRGSGKGKLLLELDVANQRREEKKLFLSIPLLEAKLVVFIKKDHFSGDVLVKENLLPGVKWLPYGESGFISDISSVAGKRANRKIKDMTALKNSMVESIPVLHKGDLITILAETEGILVTAKGVAKEDAFAGDSIKVLNFQSKKTIHARVLSDGAVKVEF